MNRFWKDLRVLWSVAATVGLLVAFAGYSGFRIMRDQQEVKKMTVAMKTVCFGRFLIDIPFDATISWRGAFIDGWTIGNWDDETGEQFNARLASNESELAQEKNERGLKSLEAITEVNDKRVRGKVFVYGRQWTYDMNGGVRHDSNEADGKGFFRLNQLSLDFSRKIIQVDDGPALAKLALQFMPLHRDTIPTLPGFCFGSAMIGEPLKADQGERVTMFVGIKDHPDISMVFNTTAGLKQGESLLQRTDKFKAEYADVTHEFRSGPKKIANIAGEELLERIRERNGADRHNFRWEALAHEDDVFVPTLSIELGSGYGRPGEQLNSSLTDTAIITLWDKITSSLRVRPTKIDAEPKPASPPPAPTHVNAHQACPATGWWRCEDGADGVAVQHGDTQFFRVGQRMPQARLLAPVNWWGKLRGQQPTFERAAVSRWTQIEESPPAPVEAAAPESPASNPPSQEA